MIPRRPRRKQAPRTTRLLTLALTFPDNDPGPAPTHCPTCGKPWFDPRASGLLDMSVLAQDVLADLKAGLEEEGRA